MVSIAANTGHMTVRGNVSGSATSTVSFGRLETAGVVIDNNNVSATSFTLYFKVLYQVQHRLPQTSVVLLL